MTDPLAKLNGGDRRSIGRVAEVVSDVQADPALFPVLFSGMLHADPLVRMRSADAVEKLTRKRPELLQPYARRLLQEVAASDQQEVRWHVAQLLPRLELEESDRAAAVALLLGYLDDPSRIVRTFSLQALAEFALRYPTLRPRVMAV
ncbi:MAG: ACT domain-containing protein, partial [Chloroflexota bacterium]|nr:ACT domain-containing protein [Chloroflexota bacterium]